MHSFYANVPPKHSRFPGGSASDVRQMHQQSLLVGILVALCSAFNKTATAEQVRLGRKISGVLENCIHMWHGVYGSCLSARLRVCLANANFIRNFCHSLAHEASVEHFWGPHFHIFLPIHPLSLLVHVFGILLWLNGLYSYFADKQTQISCLLRWVEVRAKLKTGENQRERGRERERESEENERKKTHALCSGENFPLFSKHQ